MTDRASAQIRLSRSASKAVLGSGKGSLQWVNRVGLTFGCKLPVCPYEPTFGYAASTEAMGQNRK
jgi:hypothetical protein